MRWIRLLSIVGIVCILAGCMNNAASTSAVSEDFESFVENFNDNSQTMRHVLELGESFIVDDFEISLRDEVRFLDNADRFDALENFPWLEEEFPGAGDMMDSIFESEISRSDGIFYIPVTITNLKDEDRTGVLGWLPLTTLYYHEALIDDNYITGEGIVCELLMGFYENRSQLTNRQLVELNVLLVESGRGLTTGQAFFDNIYHLPNRTIEAGNSIDVMIYISYIESGYHALRFFIPHPPEDESPATFYDFIFRVER